MSEIRNKTFKIEELVWLDPEEFISLCMTSVRHEKRENENETLYEFEEKSIIIMFENGYKLIQLFKNGKLIKSLKKSRYFSLYRDTNKKILEFFEF